MGRHSRPTLLRSFYRFDRLSFHSKDSNRSVTINSLNGFSGISCIPPWNDLVTLITLLLS